MMDHVIPGLLSPVYHRFPHPPLTLPDVILQMKQESYILQLMTDRKGLFLNYPRDKDVLFTKVDVSMKVNGQSGQKRRIG